MKLFKILTTVILASIASATSAQSTAPLTFGDSDTDDDNWNYLMHFKLWGTEGISFGNRPEFSDTQGWVGTAAGDLKSLGYGGSIGGPIIVGGSISGTSIQITTGPIRSDGTITAQMGNGIVKCSSTDLSNECSTDKVPEIRSNLSVPSLTRVNLSSLSSFNVSGRTILDVNSRCPGNEICDIYLDSLKFGNDSRLVVQMPEGGRPTRIFTNKLNFGTHPEIVVSYGKGDLKQNEYQGNLLIYVNSDITFANNDNTNIMGSIVSTGTIRLMCNIVFAGQLIANKIEVGNEIRAENFVFKKFEPQIILSILDEKSKLIKESNKWEAIQVSLSETSKVDVSFDYCFDFYSASGVSGSYAGYADFAAADANHKFPICNEGESEKVTIKAGDTKAAGIYIKPMIDGIVERDEKLWFQINNLKGATLASDYESEKGYKIYIVSNDELPTVSSELVVNVNEDVKHAFTASEFNFKHSTQTFASVIITSIPSKGQLLYNGTTVTKNQTIAVANLGKLTYQAAANEFGNNYASFGYKVVGDGTGDNTSNEYTATINVIPVNDKPTTQSSFSFAVNENPSKDATLGSITYSDVSNEINVDSYTFSLVSTDANYTEFSKYFVLTSSGDVKINGSQTFDYYAKKSYTVTATVKDDAKTEKNYGVTVNGPLTSETFTITINIKNQNLAPTINNQSFELPEKNKTSSGIVDWTSSKVVGNVTAKDPDGDNLTYKVETTGIPFDFKPGSNALIVKDGSVLDYETKSVWSFKVSVTDPSGASASATITVNLTDVNEPPEPKNVLSEYSVEENKGTGTTFGSFEVVDRDASESLTYSLSGNLNGAVNNSGNLKNKTLADIFTVKEAVSGNTRTVSFAVKDGALLDYEDLYKTSTKNATYPATVTITDKGSNSVTVKTNIAVIDVNEPSSSTTISSSSSSKPTSSSSIDSISSSSLQNDKSSSSTKATSSSSTEPVLSSAEGIEDLSSSSASGKSSSSNAKSSSSSAKTLSSSSKITSSSSVDSISSSSFQNDKSSSSKPASSSSTKAKTSSSSSKAVSSSSAKTSNSDIPDFYVKMIGPFEFEIVLDESVPSLAKKYAVMDMKGQVLTVGELSDKNALVKVPTRGAYVVKLGLGYKRVNVR